MNHELQPAIKQSPQKKRYSSLATLTKACAASALIVATLAGGAYWAAGPGLFAWSRSGDQVSESEKQLRVELFVRLDPLNLALVAKNDEQKALDSMQLTSHGMQALMNDIHGKTMSSASDLGSSTQPVETPAQKPVPSTSSKTQSQPRAEQARAPNAQAQISPVQKPRLQLAWVTLWDTDAEDDDVVRIDSQGYSRTVVLKKEAATFAVPVPKDGVINITGVRDGEGGGITVGLASGASKVTFPIMSEGQVLGLKIKVNP